MDNKTRVQPPIKYFQHKLCHSLVEEKNYKTQEKKTQ